MGVIDFQKKKNERGKEGLEKYAAEFSQITSLPIKRAFVKPGFLIFVQSIHPCTQFYYNEADKEKTGNIQYFGKQLFLAQKEDEYLIVDAYSEIQEVLYVTEKMLRPLKRELRRRNKPAQNCWSPADELTPSLKHEIETSCLENVIEYCDKHHLTGLGRISITTEDYQPCLRRPHDFHFPTLVTGW